jgi:hypothetical protein
MAGCLFTNGTHVLAGYQGSISGIGGKAEQGEEPQATALRETVEEIFGISFDIEKIRLIPQKIIVKKSYTIFVYSFEQLETMCSIIKAAGVISPLYSEIPTTVWELVLKRLPNDSEVSALCILPVVNHPRDVPFVEPYFVSDIRALIRATEPASQRPL